jgi:hypothetical protein
MSFRTLVLLLVLLLCRAALAKEPNAANPPVIDDQPLGRVVTAGAPASMFVRAHASGAITYQWRKDSAPLTNDTRVSGVTNSVLNISECLSSHAGVYAVVVTANGTSVTSSPVSLVVTQFFVGLTPTGTGAVVSITGQPADVYRIEVSVNFAAYFTNGYATNRTGVAQFIDVDTGGGFRRVRVAYDRLLPTVYPPVLSATGATVSAYGKLNETYRFEATADFIHWTNVGTFPNALGWVKFTDTNAPPAGPRFYRISPP